MVYKLTHFIYKRKCSIIKEEERMSTELMPKRKNQIKRNPKAEEIAKAILEAYGPESKEDINDALKDIFGPMFEAMLQGEMDSHLGYENNNHQPKDTDNRRNGYNAKTLKSTYGEIPIQVPRDRDGSFEPLVVSKRQKCLFD